MTGSIVTYWQQLLTVPNLRTYRDLFEIVWSNILKKEEKKNRSLAARLLPVRRQCRGTCF